MTPGPGSPRSMGPDGSHQFRQTAPARSAALRGSVIHSRTGVHGRGHGRGRRGGTTEGATSHATGLDSVSSGSPSTPPTWKRTSRSKSCRGWPAYRCAPCGSTGPRRSSTADAARAGRLLPAPSHPPAAPGSAARRARLPAAGHRRPHGHRSGPDRGLPDPRVAQPWERHQQTAHRRGLPRARRPPSVLAGRLRRAARARPPPRERARPSTCRLCRSPSPTSSPGGSAATTS